MYGRSVILPVMMVLVIAFLAIFTILQRGDPNLGLAIEEGYPYQVCEFNEYCEGDTCERGQTPFVLYHEYNTGQPRLELPRINPSVVRGEVPDGSTFSTRGGEIAAMLTVYNDGGLDWVGTSLSDGREVEHFASGTCRALQRS